MVSASITITPELAIRIGALAEHYQDSSVEIAYDDGRDERLWQVIFDNTSERHRWIINDETGIAKPDTSFSGITLGGPEVVLGRDVHAG